MGITGHLGDHVTPSGGSHMVEDSMVHLNLLKLYGSLNSCLELLFLHIKLIKDGFINM